MTETESLVGKGYPRIGDRQQVSKQRPQENMGIKPCTFNRKPSTLASTPEAVTELRAYGAIPWLYDQWATLRAQ